MENILNRITRRLMLLSSRRRILIKAGKAVSTLVAFTAGDIIINEKKVFAANYQNRLRCCMGAACTLKSCPPDTTPLYTWACLNDQNHQNYVCTDCFQLIATTPYKIYDYLCTYAVHVPNGDERDGNEQNESEESER